MHKARKEAGLSQKGLAQKAGMSQQLISRIEKGKENISVITLGKIARAMGREIKIDTLSIKQQEQKKKTRAN